MNFPILNEIGGAMLPLNPSPSNNGIARWYLWVAVVMMVLLFRTGLVVSVSFKKREREKSTGMDTVTYSFNPVLRGQKQVDLC